MDSHTALRVKKCGNTETPLTLMLRYWRLRPRLKSNTDEIINIRPPDEKKKRRHSNRRTLLTPSPCQ
ncbi:Hypothetical predicted protein, partial [Scomber scombrus]